MQIKLVLLLLFLEKLEVPIRLFYIVFWRFCGHSEEWLDYLLFVLVLFHYNLNFSFINVLIFAKKVLLNCLGNPPHKGRKDC